MLTLYYKPTCVFARRVIAVIERLELEVDMKDITDSVIEAELIEKTEKSQTPFLIDINKDISLHESDDIVTHLQKNYGSSSQTTSRPRVHISDSACVSCEA